MKLALMEIGQKFLMQKESRLIRENEISIHEFEDGYSFNNNLKSIFCSKALLKKNNLPKEIESIGLNKKKISFISFSLQSNFIPFIIFNENSKENYLKGKSLNEYKLKTCYDIINSNDIVNIYTLREDKVFINFFSKYEIKTKYHYKTIILNQLIGLNKETLKKNIIYINFQKNSFDIFYFINNKFNLCNSYLINNTEDFLYYFFYFTEQFNLSSDSFSIVFLGKFTSFKRHYTGIRDFQTDISFISNHTENKEYINNHPAPFLANIFC